MKIFAKLLAALSVVAAVAFPVAAQQRAVMENTRTTNDVVYVSTPTKLLLVGTSYYPYTPDSSIREYVAGKLKVESLVVTGAVISTATDARFDAVGASTKALNINISTETAARILADQNLGISTAALQLAINAEAARAIAAEVALSVNIATETAARVAADNSIGVATNSIRSDLTAETAARIAADLSIGVSTMALQAAINAEAAARQAQDTFIAASTNTLQSNITAEAAARQSQDSAIAVSTNILQSNINAEAAARAAQDATIGASTQAIVDQKGQPNGIASLDGGGKIPVAQLPNSVMEYKGAWVPATNTPTLADGIGNNGDVYRASADGSANTGHGSINYFTGDFIIYSGTIWERSPMADGVMSVNGYTGAVTLVTDDIAEDGSPINLWFTNARAQSANQAQFSQVATATNTLQSNINAEAAARQAQDTQIANSTNTLQSNINSEAATRLAADVAIGVATNTLRTDLSAESATRLAADNAIAVSTTAEAAARQAQDTQIANSTNTLQSNINAEAAARAAQDVVIGASTNTLRTDLNSEIATRAAADTAIGVATNTLRTDLSAETAARVAQDTQIANSTNTLQANINAEASARAVADTAIGVATNTLRTDLTAEAVSRQAQDTNIAASTNTLQSNINAEAAARQAQDTTIGASTQSLRTDKVETASNVGSGSGVFKQKTLVDLQFKSLVAGANITITPGTDDITIAGTGGGGSGHTITSGTVVGGTMPTSTSAATRNKLGFDRAAFDILDDSANDTTIVKAKGYQYVASTKTIITTDQVFTTGGWTTFAASSVTIVSGNNKLMVMVSGTLSETGSGQVPQIAVFLDGAYIDAGQASGRGCASSREPGAGSIGYFPFQCTIVTDSAVSAGAHTVQIAGRTTGSTGRMRCGAGSPENAAACYVQVIELATGGSGFAAPSSSATFFSGDLSGTNTSFGVCQATVTLTTSGGPVDLKFNGQMGSTGGIATSYGWTIFQDGAPVNNATTASASGTPGLWMYDGSPVPGYPRDAAGNIFLSSVTAGSHSYCIAFAGATWDARCDLARCQLSATEVRNAPGTGDVSSNGNNGFSGANSFTGPVSFTGQVSGSGVNFQYLASSSTLVPGSSGSNTSFNGCMTGSTVTVTMSNNRAMVNYAGSWDDGTSAGKIVRLYLLVDGAFVQGENGTDAFINHVNPSGSYSQNMSFSYLTPTLSAGSHSICIGGGTTSGGNWQANDRTNGYLSLTEFASGGNGVSAAASTATTITTGLNVVGTTWASFTGSTVTLQMAGGKMLVGFTCNASHSVGGDAGDIGLLINGNYVPGETSSIGLLTHTASAANDPVPASLTWMSSGTYTGPTTASIIFRSKQAAVSFYLNQNNDSACTIWANEVRNAAGTGDVSSNASNTMSGINNFTGPVRGIPVYVAVFESPSTTNTTYTINLAAGTTSGGTLTFLKGSSFPANAKVIYQYSLTAMAIPGSAGGANNSSVTVGTAQLFTASSNASVTVSNNPGAGYPASGSVIFFGYEP